MVIVGFIWLLMVHFGVRWFLPPPDGRGRFLPNLLIDFFEFCLHLDPA